MKIYLKIITLILLGLNLYAHELDIKVKDNNDNTMTITALFNTGESAAGVLLKLEDKLTKEILYEQRIPSNNKLVIDIPKIAYLIVLDEGDDDITIKEGIPPKEGFQEQNSKKKEKKRTDAQFSTSKAITISIAIAFLLLFATIFISIRNTNKLMKMLNNKR
ncbi:conserved hypothetical protein [Arcobacter nitrofigilis DSM 7299]|uniref:Transmembrane protein n=1 Tax=Arcobacter nitrofigilis (strain ATCC 33309 / DSM 7299 / CCUG 15893 / LMG 7604 / NCTC 12251 / CI) TaxID=572480 RepID=D5UZH8_ARCNC|nr:hypothetical protein [Arcobacter nitrofigilis]ADG92215.1 conserved hypothetical protein [Arcobacter nitrofigilis DSM 7299]